MEKTTKLKVGIAGYGVIGKRRRQFIDQNPYLTTVAVCDRNFNSDGKFEDGVRFYTNFEGLLYKENLDIIFVCMPPDIAPKVTVASLEKNIHVFCEKPPGRTVTDIERVIECEKNHKNAKLKYGFNHRYHDSVRDALRIIQSKEFGDIINMRGIYGKSAMIPWPRPSGAQFENDPRCWRTSHEVAGGGILLDQGIHMVDLMHLFVGDFVDIKSFVRNNYWKHNVEDNAYALMRAESGAIAILHSTATQWRHQFKLEINLSKGALLLSGILSGTKSYGQETLTVVYSKESDNGNPKEQTTSYVDDNSWRDEINEFVDAIVNNKEIGNGNSADALRSMKTVYRIYDADEEWKRFSKIENII